MSKRTHDKQVQRARAKRQTSRLDRRHTRNRIVILVMAGLLVLSLVGTAFLGVFADRQDPAADAEQDAEPVATAEPCPDPDGAPEVDSEIYDQPPLAELDDGVDYLMTIDTTCGAFTIELDTDNAPIATANLIGLAEDGYYDGVLFHRVVNQFVIQAGDPSGTGCGQEDCVDFDPDAPTFPGYQFEDELDTAEELFTEVRDEFLEILQQDFAEDLDEGFDPEQVPGGYPRGTVAMANAGSDSNGSQFFVTQGDPTILPGPAFTVLGRVVDGMDVVDRIAGVQVGERDRPLTDVRIVAMSVERRTR